jgi:hypothetical protein
MWSLVIPSNVIVTYVCITTVAHLNILWKILTDKPLVLRHSHNRKIPEVFHVETYQKPTISHRAVT